MARPPCSAAIASVCSVASLAVSLALTACNPHTFERALMATAYRPRWEAHAPRAPTPGNYVLLAGDMHVHVSPPDTPDDVSRDVAETIAIAEEEGIDFVVFTPHVPARFFADGQARDAVARGQAELRRSIAAALSGAGPRAPVLVPGFEYTDHDFGHVGASFADLDAVLAKVPLEVARAEPARFFEQWVANGGLLVVNHPVVTPLDSVLQRARGNMSWRPWTHPQGPFPPEILAIHRLAFGFEAYNAAVTQMRDRMFIGDSLNSLREVTSRLDLEIETARRRISPVGGSDSHAGYLRASMFVLATARTAEGVHDALVHGRTCVKGPEACSFEVRAPGGTWVTVGGTVRSDHEVEVRATGSDAIAVFVDGAPVASPAPGVPTRVPVPPNLCAVVRAQVGESYSAPVYVNCDF